MNNNYSEDETMHCEGVSVVIPLFNKRLSIRRAIDSVLLQDIENLEIIVVDDGSTDNPSEVLAGYDDKIIIVQQQNSGPSAARNRGTELCKYPHIVVLDADDELLPGVLRAHMECRHKCKNTNLSLVSFKVIKDNKNIRNCDIANRCGLTPLSTDFFCADEFKAAFVFNVASGAICFDRALFDEVGGFDVQLRCWEITDMLLRTVLKA